MFKSKAAKEQETREAEEYARKIEKFYQEALRDETKAIQRCDGEDIHFYSEQVHAWEQELKKIGRWR
jgi:hypothetical protein